MTIAPTSGFREAKFIVSPTAGFGNYTTIAAAISAASAGDTIFVRTGSYTENLSLKSGVNITAWSGDDNEDNVEIIGKATYSSAGTVNISNIRLTTNSDYLLEVTGSAASIINLESCFLNCLNHTGIHYTSSSSSSTLYLYQCEGNIATTGISLFTCTSSGMLTLDYCEFLNTGLSTTASTQSGTSLQVFFCTCYFPFSFSGTSANNSFFQTSVDCSQLNTACLTLANTSQNLLLGLYYASGTASALSIGSGTQVTISSATISSNNTDAITGAGTIFYSNITFTGTSKSINVTTKDPLISRPTFSTVNQVITSTGTYTPTLGMVYCSIECIGGGGGGGGAAITGVGQFSLGAGGGGGEYARGIFSSATIGASQSVTIGAAGASNAGTTGGNGGTTSVGALISSGGGSGGTTAGAGTSGIASSGSGGTGGSGGDFRSPGFNGIGALFIVASNIIYAGPGGNSQYGSGGLQPYGSSAGNAGLGYGAGGGGGLNLASQAAAVGGGAGAKGVVIIQEYILS